MPTLFLDTVCVHDTLIISIKGVGIEGGYPSQLLEGGGGGGVTPTLLYIGTQISTGIRHFMCKVVFVLS